MLIEVKNELTFYVNFYNVYVILFEPTSKLNKYFKLMYFLDCIKINR